MPPMLGWGLAADGPVDVQEETATITPRRIDASTGATLRRAVPIRREDLPVSRHTRIAQTMVTTLALGLAAWLAVPLAALAVVAVKGDRASLDGDRGGLPQAERPLRVPHQRRHFRQRCPGGGAVTGEFAPPNAYHLTQRGIRIEPPSSRILRTSTASTPSRSSRTARSTGRRSTRMGL